MPIHLIVRDSRDHMALIADVPCYDGPIPRKGDYVYHPPFEAKPHIEWSGQASNIAGYVVQVVWGIYARPVNDEDHFVGTAYPFVEVVFG